MTRTERKKASSRTSDLAWGSRNGLMLAAIVLTPAALAAGAAGLREFRQFLPIGCAYLLFGALAGLLVGIARRRLAQKAVAVVVGALVGGLGFTLLMAFADPRGASRTSLVALGALLGFAVGAFIGWWTWRRAAVGGLR